MKYRQVCNLIAAKRCRDSGQSVAAIAKLAKVSTSTVYKWLRAMK